MNRRSLLFSLFVLSSLSLCAQTKAYTPDDTLRGSITRERAWWDLKYYHLDVKVDPEQKSLTGKVTVQFQVLDPYNVLQIDLQQPLQITRVTHKKKKLSFKRAGKNAYLINLDVTPQKGSLQSIDVYYGGVPLEAKNPPWEGGIQWTKSGDGSHFIASACQGVGASSWWPCKDHLYDEPDSMLISATVPRGYVDVSNGRLREKIEGKNSTTYRWFVNNPINNYGVNINVARYVHFADTLMGENGKLDLDFYVLPENLEKAKIQFRQAKGMLRAFEYWFGPYPFYEDGYKLVEVPYLGMEHQSSVTYGNSYRNGYKGATDLSGTGWGLKFDFIIIHESGHEWFANSITYKDVADMWIHESFTNYSEALYLEYFFGTEAATDYVVGTRQNVHNDIPVIGIYNVDQRGSGDMYPKGGNMIHTIRHCIDNDELFRNILHGLNKTFYHQTVTTQQIEEFISKNAGRDYSKIFDQYLRTIKIPQLEYYFKEDQLFYRWTNVVKGFDLPIKIAGGRAAAKITPTEEWNQVPISRADLFDPKFVERMYYVTLKNIQR